MKVRQWGLKGRGWAEKVGPFVLFHGLVVIQDQWCLR